MELVHYYELIPRRRLEDNFRKDFKEIDVNTRNWIDSVLGKVYWGAFLKAVVNLRVS